MDNNQEFDDDVDIIENSQINSPNYSPIRSSNDSRQIDVSPIQFVLPKLDRPPKYYGQMQTKFGYLRSIEEIPSKYRCIFSKYQFFNRVQSEVMDNVLYSDHSFVVSSPTGSGKTIIFELAIIRLMLTLEDINYTGNFKIIYIAPLKALCTERLCDWHQKFSQIGLSCIEITGDTERLEFKNLESYNIIITTPEKWDSITRKWRENRHIVQVVKLFMVDEIHLLNDKKRGPTLEAIVSRMKTIQKTVELELSQEQQNNVSSQSSVNSINTLTHIRFIATSATLNNIEDIGEWLHTEKSQAITRKFGEEYRPVPLNKVVLGYPLSANSSPFKFDLMLNYKLPALIQQYSNKKPTLVFCTTRKSIYPTAEILSKTLTFSYTDTQSEYIKELANQITDTKLRQMILVGIGWHHAGIHAEDRAVVESLFKSALLPVLLTTSTLSMGVNLPAHLVIIKSTDVYENGGFHDYNEITLQQMIGRAGRPQYDSYATAIIMTKLSMKEYYESIVTGTELIESNLHKHIGEYLNSEIVLHTITDLFVAMNWLKTTFLYIRVFKNPKHYNFQPQWTKNKIEDKLIEMCQIEINKLKSLKLVETSDEMGLELKPTRNGELMAQYYLSFETIRLFLKIEGRENIFQLLSMICESAEFSDVYLRVNDKKILNTLNKSKFVDTIRFSLPGRISNRAMKVNCLIQAIFGSLPIHDISLKIETENLMRTGERISNCLCQYLKETPNSFVAFKNALLLAKCFNARLWENSLYVAQQLPKIGPVTAKLLVNAQKTTFDSILESNPRDLERIMNRGPPLGNTIIEYVQHIPQYSLTINGPDLLASPPRYASVTIKIINASKLNSVSTVGKNHTVHILIGDSENNVLFYQRMCDQEILLHESITKQVQLKLNDEHEVFGHLISETWVGIDVEITKNMPPVSTYLINAFKNMKDKTEIESVSNLSGYQSDKNHQTSKQNESICKSSNTNKKAKAKTDENIESISTKRETQLTNILDSDIGIDEKNNKNHSESTNNLTDFQPTENHEIFEQKDKETISDNQKQKYLNISKRTTSKEVKNNETCSNKDNLLERVNLDENFNQISNTTENQQLTNLPNSDIVNLNKNEPTINRSVTETEDKSQSEPVCKLSRDQFQSEPIYKLSEEKSPEESICNLSEDKFQSEPIYKLSEEKYPNVSVCNLSEDKFESESAYNLSEVPDKAQDKSAYSLSEDKFQSEPVYNLSKVPDKSQSQYGYNLSKDKYESEPVYSLSEAPDNFQSKYACSLSEDKFQSEPVYSLSEVRDKSQRDAASNLFKDRSQYKPVWNLSDFHLITEHSVSKQQDMINSKIMYDKKQDLLNKCESNTIGAKLIKDNCKRNDNKLLQNVNRDENIDQILNKTETPYLAKVQNPNIYGEPFKNVLDPIHYSKHYNNENSDLINSINSLQIINGNSKDERKFIRKTIPSEEKSIANEELLPNTSYNNIFRTPKRTPRQLNDYESPIITPPPFKRSRSLNSNESNLFLQQQGISGNNSSKISNDQKYLKNCKQYMQDNKNLFEIGQHFMAIRNNEYEIPLNTLKHQHADSFSTPDNRHYNVPNYRTQNLFKDPNKIENTINSFSPPIVTQAQNNFEISSCNQNTFLTKRKNNEEAFSHFEKSSQGNCKDLKQFALTPKKMFPSSTTVNKNLPNDNKHPKVLEIEKVDYSFSLFNDETYKELPTTNCFDTPKTVSWRSPLTSEKYMSTTSSSNSSKYSPMPRGNRNKSYISSFINSINAGHTPKSFSSSKKHSSPGISPNFISSRTFRRFDESKFKADDRSKSKQKEQSLFLTNMNTSLQGENNNSVSKQNEQSRQKVVDEEWIKEKLRYYHPLTPIDWVAVEKLKQKTTTENNVQSCDNMSDIAQNIPLPTSARNVENPKSQTKQYSSDETENIKTNKNLKSKSRTSSLSLNIKKIIYQLSDKGAREAEKRSQKSTSGNIIYTKLSDLERDIRLENKLSQMSNQLNQSELPDSVQSDDNFVKSQYSRMEKLQLSSSNIFSLNKDNLKNLSLEKVYKPEPDIPFPNLGRETNQKHLDVPYENIQAVDNDKTNFQLNKSHSLKRKIPFSDINNSEEYYPPAKSPSLSYSHPYPPYSHNSNNLQQNYQNINTFPICDSQNHYSNASQTNVHRNHLHSNYPLNELSYPNLAQNCYLPTRSSLFGQRPEMNTQIQPQSLNEPWQRNHTNQNYFQINKENDSPFPNYTNFVDQSIFPRQNQQNYNYQSQNHINPTPGLSNLNSFYPPNTTFIGRHHNNNNNFPNEIQNLRLSSHPAPNSSHFDTRYNQNSRNTAPFFGPGSNSADYRFGSNIKYF